MPTEETRRGGHTRPFIQHLYELRTVLVRGLLALGAGMAVAGMAAPRIMLWLKQPLWTAGRNPDEFLATLEVAGGFSITMKIALWGGLVLAAPIIVLLLAGFVFPGLTARERNVIRSSSLAAVILFIIGASLGYFVTLPVALGIMFTISEWVGVSPGPIMITNYIAFCLRLLFGFGIAFELPVVIVALGTIGIVSVAQLRSARPAVIVSLLILAMILTPPDIFTQLLMAIPLVLLYEVSIVLLWLRARRKKPTSP